MGLGGGVGSWAYRLILGRHRTHQPVNPDPFARLFGVDLPAADVRALGAQLRHDCANRHDSRADRNLQGGVLASLIQELMHPLEPFGL